MARPAQGRYPAYILGYIDTLPQAPVLDLLAQQYNELTQLVQSVPESRELHAYAPGKWTVRGVMGHITDWERIFGYRAVVYARGIAEPQPGMDENDLAAASQADARPLAHWLREWQALRTANLLAAETVTDWDRRVPTAIPGDWHVTLEGQFLLVAGHVQHHMNILRERYLQA